MLDVILGRVDKFTFIPTLIMAFMVTVLVFLHSILFSTGDDYIILIDLFSIFSVCILLASAFLYFLVKSIQLMFQGRARVPLSIWVAFIMSAVLLYFSPQYIRKISHYFEYIRFSKLKEGYIVAIKNDKNEDGFGYHDFIFYGFIDQQHIIYDESDEILLDPEKRSDKWSRRASVYFKSCPYGYRALGDHFYHVTFNC